MLNKKSVDDINVKGKKVLVRCDFNVPLKAGVIQNYNRIDGALPTIKKLLSMNAKVILCSHLGKPKGEPLPEMSLAPVAEALTERLGVTVKFINDPQVTGPETQKAASELKEGEVILLENVRFEAGEEANDEAFCKKLAALADVYVNDAFGTAHRKHASTYGVAKLLPNAVGFLMGKEINAILGAINNPDRPFVAITGGSKISDKKWAFWLGESESLFSFRVLVRILC